MKSKICILLIVLLQTMATYAQPPNNSIFSGSADDGFNLSINSSLPNAIFSGGAGDGAVRAANIVASNNIFTGGAGDGWYNAMNSITANTIFIGGAGDGWNRAVNAAVSNDIFLGGIGDGWNRAANISVSNTIFAGGFGDGWHNAGNAAPANNIFHGGAGDGWANMYQPLGPLPVNFLYFTARKQGKTAALLSWKTAQETNSSHFDVERSTDAVNFSFIGKVLAKGNTTTESSYGFTDNAPEKGFNYYRLKQVDINGRFIYTVARVVNFDQLDAGQVKYYPNPTNGMLTIELTDEMKGQEKWLTISNTAGIVTDQFKIPANNSSIIMVNLYKYPRGIYFIQVKTNCCNSLQRVVLQ